TRVGIGYIDDCYMLSLNYIGDFTFNGNVQANNTVMLSMSLRTIGGTGGSQSETVPRRQGDAWIGNNLATILPYPAGRWKRIGFGRNRTAAVQAVMTGGAGLG